ncbi:hypothetical protein KSP39_PZI014544 [Platanthera zijinensis]|uniref:C2 domain-containing protein n=1 Tax=Platanthera zijinensis TaxID=2320716 RepID=A0AAP0BAI9_9ASPA
MSSGGGGYQLLPPPSSPPSNFHLLEVTLISAQDLFPSSRSLRSYAVIWVQPEHRLRTRLDTGGHTNPTWNDKFVFRVDKEKLCSDTCAIQINIYAARPRFLPGPNALLGTARVILSTLRPSPASTHFVALQVRRPTSLRPQGILNIGVALADSYVCSLPLYRNLHATAFAYHDLLAAAAAMNTDDATLSLPQQQPEDSERNGSVAGVAGETERVVLEKKLKKWRSEIPAVAEDQMGWGKEGQSPASTDDEGSLRREKPRRPRAMSCFNLAGQYANDMEDDTSSTSSRSSTGQR